MAAKVFSRSSAERTFASASNRSSRASAAARAVGGLMASHVSNALANCLVNMSAPT